MWEAAEGGEAVQGNGLQSAGQVGLPATQKLEAWGSQGLGEQPLDQEPLPRVGTPAQALGQGFVKQWSLHQVRALMWLALAH